MAANVDFRRIPPERQLSIRVTVAFGRSNQFRRHIFQPTDLSKLAFQYDQLLQLIQEPRVDVRQFIDMLDGHPRLDGKSDVENAIFVRPGQLAFDFIIGRLQRRAPEILLAAPQAKVADFQAAQGLLQ